MDETKIRLLYNKETKELMMIVSPVEEGSEAYNKMRELAKEMVEIELKKVVSDEKIDLEKSVDVTPSSETKSTETKSEVKSEPVEVKPEAESKSAEIKSEAETKSAETKSEAETKSTVTPTEETKSEPVEANAKTKSSTVAPVNKPATPLNTTFVIKTGETQLSVKDFAEANGLFQPRFMSGNKFRVTEKEVEVYEKAGYTH